MNRPVSEYRGSAMWFAVQAILADLKATGEIALNTAPDYVTAYICRELVAKKIAGEEALRPRRVTDEHQHGA